jgi:hypothetical protein
MPSRNRVVMSISVPPETAREWQQLAMKKGESLSQLFREMFSLYKQDRFKEEFFDLQRYGRKKAQTLKITEKSIERLIFEDR